MSEVKIYKTIAEVMTKINAISKGRKNTQQGFNFRGIDDVMNELHPVMAECGLFVVPEVLDEYRTEGKTKNGSSMFYTRLKIKFSFYAEDGSSVAAVVIGEAMDTGDKASNKALSIGLKYAMLQVFCIPTEDDKDPDAQSPQFEKVEPKKQEVKKIAVQFDKNEANEIANLMNVYSEIFNEETRGKYREMLKAKGSAFTLQSVKAAIDEANRGGTPTEAETKEMEALF